MVTLAQTLAAGDPVQMGEYIGTLNGIIGEADTSAET
jgi:hypothetical protein